MAEGCLFCKIASKQIPAELVFENDAVVAFRDIRPQAKTHVLIVPRLHVATLNDLADDQAQLVGQLVLAARDIAKSEGLAERGWRAVWNVNADAGQTVFHIHLHLLGGRSLGWPPG